MSLRVGIDLRLFHMLAESDSRPLSAGELAQRSNAEVLLIGMFPPCKAPNVIIIN